ncbi:unnamed protein product, partial [Protopolystoma xenopodis]
PTISSIAQTISTRAVSARDLDRIDHPKRPSSASSASLFNLLKGKTTSQTESTTICTSPTYQPARTFTRGLPDLGSTSCLLTEATASSGTTSSRPASEPGVCIPSSVAGDNKRSYIDNSLPLAIHANLGS